MTSEVVIAREGSVGRLRLNRPKAIHALTREMCNLMSEALLAWRHDPGIKLVIIDHADGRGFCSGGDVVALFHSGHGDGSRGRAFFRDEYRLNHLLFTYAKPTVAIMDGITMGGGVGLAMPCKYRVATENTRFAMPETQIGLFPDVGGGWYLPRLPGRTGYFLALTGARLEGPECRSLGVATHYIRSETCHTLAGRIVEDPDRLQGILGAPGTSPFEARIAHHLGDINKLFASDTMEGILAALEADTSEWAHAQRTILSTKSPLACKNSLRLLNEGALRQSFADEMSAEYALAARVLHTHDFLEGVRALLIEKDNLPRWDPPTYAGVTDEMVEALFAPLPADDQWTAFPETATNLSVEDFV